MKQNRIIIVIAVLAFVFILVGLVVAETASGQQFSACLSRHGYIYRVALGDQPARPCRRTDKKISWNQAGPQGIQGNPGEQGPQGEAGPAGPAGPLGLYGSGLVSIDNIQDCLSTEHDGIQCKEKALLSLEMKEGQEINVELVATEVVYDQNNEPYEIETVTILHAAKSPNGVNVRFAEDSDNLELILSPASPVKTSTYIAGYSGNIDAKCMLLKDNLVNCIHDRFNTLKVIETESLGVLTAHIEPYAAGDTETQLIVPIANYGTFRTNYIVTVTECSSGIEPPVAQSVTLNGGEYYDFTFNLKSASPFEAEMTCLVTLNSSTGMIYDSIEVFAPTPNGG